MRQRKMKQRKSKQNKSLAKILTLGIAAATAVSSMSVPGGLLAPETVYASDNTGTAESGDQGTEPQEETIQFDVSIRPNDSATVYVMQGTSLADTDTMSYQYSSSGGSSSGSSSDSGSSSGSSSDSGSSSESSSSGGSTDSGSETAPPQETIQFEVSIIPNDSATVYVIQGTSLVDTDTMSYRYSINGTDYYSLEEFKTQKTFSASQKVDLHVRAVKSEDNTIWAVGNCEITTQRASGVPTISGADKFSDRTDVTITATNGAIIYYTADGTVPTNGSQQYNTPITLTETTTIKAIAIEDGHIMSDVVGMAFTKESSGGSSSDGGTSGGSSSGSSSDSGSSSGSSSSDGGTSGGSSSGGSSSGSSSDSGSSSGSSSSGGSTDSGSETAPPQDDGNI